MDSKDLRQKFLDFFEKKGHKIAPPASLIPENDPSVLFTTAGMQQFKRFYAAPDEAPTKTVATCQPCIRTSDIEEVGDEDHLTFFEMLGNFSFNDPASPAGGYFKKEAIEYAWEFLTEVLNIDKNRIHATYFKGNDNIEEDKESLSILKSIDGLKEIEPQGEDNFWSLATENSPGGPTVEFYVDDVEVWNLVFNEYVFQNGKYEKSEFRGVDTGMGLERMLAVLKNKTDVYQTDLFETIIQKINIDDVKSLRIIADHAKAATFLLNQNILPSNKDQGYITRRLIRRAMVKLNSLGKDIMLSDLAEKVFEIYSGIYEFNRDNIIDEIKKEENKFRATLNAGLKILKSKTEISGKDLFDLYQSYGLPMEIAVEESKNLNIEISNQTIEQFNNEMKTHQDLSRTASAGMFKGGLTSQSEQTTKYHTATHLLLAALRKVLGNDIHQRGSNITDERLRFDFSYPEKMTDEQIKKVEDLVNENIKADLPVSMEEMSLEEAEKCGAIGEFGEKYGFKVKVYSMGEFSKEICGGPHVEHTGVLGHFKIIKEESSSAGIRRIKAVLE